MLNATISLRSIAAALVVASLAACSSSHAPTPPAAGAADKAAEKANHDALKGFSSGKAPAWESHKSAEKPSSYTPWEASKAKEGERHE